MILNQLLCLVDPIGGGEGEGAGGGLRCSDSTLSILGESPHKSTPILCLVDYLEGGWRLHCSDY